MDQGKARGMRTYSKGSEKNKVSRIGFEVMRQQECG